MAGAVSGSQATNDRPPLDKPVIMGGVRGPRQREGLVIELGTRATTRERRLARADRLEEWAAGNTQRSAEAYEAARRVADVIPMGQPILVGHHSERRHRRDIARIDSGMRQSFDTGRKAERQANSAAEIRAQAERAIYDDDPDAIERLEAKLAALEAAREAVKAKRAEIRKAGGAKLRAMSGWDREEVMRAAGAPQYRVTNLGGQVTQTRERLERLRRERVQGPRDRMITARFTSVCETCGAALVKGTAIRYNRQQGARCVSCPTEEA